MLQLQELQGLMRRQASMQQVEHRLRNLRLVTGEVLFCVQSLPAMASVIMQCSSPAMSSAAC